MRSRLIASVFIVIGIAAAGQPAEAGLRAGAARVDISPPELPVLVNGGMTSRSAGEVRMPIHARGLVLEDGETRIALVVVDSCLMPRDLLDAAKERASETTGIPAEHMLISATHAHSCPSCVGALGTSPDDAYPAFLEDRLVETIERAAGHLEPAKIGAAVEPAPEYTALRRWVRRPDRMLEDPFGNRTVRANMHPGYQSPEATGPSGPEDPDLSVLSVQSTDGRPIAFVGNFSMHYFSGVRPVHPDYFGLFARRIEERLGSGSQSDRPFVAMMSHAPSGDIWRRDYLQPPPEEQPEISGYTDGLVEIAMRAYERIEHRGDVTLAMAQAELPLRYRTPDKQLLEWSRRIVEEMGDRPPKTKPEVYAREQILLHEMQRTELILQAIRIGEIGLTAIPNEVYALTSLKLKEQSPFETTINIELANGAEGYIPPPEQHPLGGYNTWPARSAGLEVEAEPKIVETVLGLLEEVAGEPRREASVPDGPAAQAVLDAEPAAYWRLDELAGPRALDETGKNDGIYETGVVFYLQGPRSERFCGQDEANRSAHFAGGRVRTHLPEPGDAWSVELWFWNGMPREAREVTGWLFSRGREHAFGGAGAHLGLDGTAGKPGCVVFSTGEQGTRLVGDTPVERWMWHHAVLVRDGTHVRVYLDGEKEIDAEAPVASAEAAASCFIGGRNDNRANFEGRIDEVAVYDRALSEKEARMHFAAANR